MRTKAIIAAAALALAASAAAEDFKLVVNGSNGLSSLSRQQVSQLFLKRTTKWPNGQAAQPVEPSDERTRAAFCRAVHGKTLNALRSYWNQVIFSGRDVPPVEKSGDDAVVDFVRANQGAIGYVSADASTAGVKVIQVKD